MPRLELAQARSWSAECQGAYVSTHIYIYIFIFIFIVVFIYL